LIGCNFSWVSLIQTDFPSTEPEGGRIFAAPVRNLAPPAGFKRVHEPNRERGGLPTMTGGSKPVLPVTVFTDYI
jgi:hypothetical protein